MTSRPTVAIIGSGFGGLAAAIELQRTGNDLVIFERGDDVGGVWRDNTYPGAACDVPSPYYSFSFAPHAQWPHRFSRQPAILEYLRGIADRFDLYRFIRFGTTVASARYDESTGRWTVTTSAGEAHEVDAVVSAVGQLSEPAIPDIPGIGSFTGESFHSAQWDHDVDLTGQRVAVLGTGASAIQFVPQIQPQVESLTVFQRSAAYLLPRPDRAFGRLHHKVFSALPLTQRVERGAWWGVTETVAAAFLFSPTLARAVTAYSRWHMRRQAGSRELFDKVWPDYPVGCKRVLFTSEYLPALRQPNATLVPERVVQVTPTGVIDESGTHHAVDVIIYGTGFRASQFLAGLEVTGEGGRDLHEAWDEGAAAYLGVSVPSFHNFFLMYGPNTNIGSGSVVFMHEQQASHIADAVEMSRTLKAPVAVREEVAAAYDEEMQGRLRDSVWTRCDSWYRDASGRISSNWPGGSLEYRRRTRELAPGDYRTVDVRDQTEVIAG